MKIEPIQKRCANSGLRRLLFAGFVVGLLLALAVPAAILADVKIDGQLVRVETNTLKAVFERGVLTSLVRKTEPRLEGSIS